jgi:hypothetical protein
VSPTPCPQGPIRSFLGTTRGDLHGANQELKRINQALQAENPEHKRAEGALRASERNFQLLVETIPGYRWNRPWKTDRVLMTWWNTRQG